MPETNIKLIWSWQHLTEEYASKSGIHQPPSDVHQRSKLTFSKSHLLVTFNSKMVGIKKFWSPDLISRGGHCGMLHTCTYVYYTERPVCNTFLCRIVSFTCLSIKNCNNGQDKEKEETPMSGSRNGLLQSCWDQVTNRQWHTKPFK